MKRLIVLLIAITMLLVSCGPAFNEEEQTLKQFVDAMKVYDTTEMSEFLTEFPDNTPYVYLDDIFNDAKYQELYRLLYTDIEYAVTSSENNRLTVDFTMPNVQKLYTDTAAMVMNLALSDETLVNKLNENEENGIVLIQEMMLALAKQEGSVERMTRTFTLTFERKGTKKVIVCDDELRALLTGNFFLSKNTKLPE